MDSTNLESAYRRCQQRYPTIDLSFEDFRTRAETAGADIARLCHEDLFLATACSRGDRVAWEYFADDYLPLLHRLAVQACRQFQEGEDIAQEIVTGLISEKKKLAGYNGTGSLAGWLRVAVAHAAIDRFRRARREVSLEEEDGPVGDVPVEDPILTQGQESLDARWGPVFVQVLEAEVRALPSRDRLILGLYYLQEVPLKIIGRQFGVHEATASRWLDNLRRMIRKNVERILRVRHGLRKGEVDSLWRIVAERELMSLKAVLDSQGGGQRVGKPALKT